MFIETGEQYRQSLVGRDLEIYAGGERVAEVTTHPLTMPGVNAIALLYDLAQEPELDALMQARSHLTGAKVHRYCHLPQNSDDLLKKIQASRKAAEISPISGLASWGVDLLSALSIVTYTMQHDLGTPYYDRFLALSPPVSGAKSLERCRRHRRQRGPPPAAVGAGRPGSLCPCGRADQRRESSCEVPKRIRPAPRWLMSLSSSPRGPCAPVIETMPWPSPSPPHTPGLKMICRAGSFAQEDSLDAPMSGRFSLVETLTIFEDVFVPWERVFMCGEWAYAGQLVELFATYHRHTYAGAKAAMLDLLIGAAALAAEYNGVADARHIQDKLADLMQASELIYAAGVAAALESTTAGPGTAVPDPVKTNAG